MSMPIATTRLLLDTHTLLWYADQSAALPARTRSLLDAASSELYISVVSFWELATLTSLQRISLKPSLAQWFNQIKQGDAEFLSITDNHLAAYATLPQIKDHRDPFDRLLIAQALTENLTLVSRDGRFAAYPDLRTSWG